MEKKRFSIEELKNDIYIVDSINEYGDEIDINKDINNMFSIKMNYNLKNCCIDIYSKSISKNNLFNNNIKRDDTVR